MSTKSTAPIPNPSLAALLGCLTEAELCELARIERSTAENWRKRGKGPPYARFGNEFLYPTDTATAYLRANLRTPGSVDAKSVL
jgi:hypothetical protein